MKVASLEIELLANIARLQKDMNSAVGTVDRSMGAIEKSVESAKRMLGSIGAGLGLGALLSQTIKLTDQYIKFTAQLKLATTSQREYAQAYSDVQRISKVAQADLGATGVLYARIVNGTRELGIEQAKVAAITETTNLALKVSGATTEESASATLQLSQAFASGVLRGEEFNAVNEAAPRLMKALADGMGVPVGALREMASQGKITSQVMAEALPRALADLREEAKSVQTIGGAFTLLKNQVLELVGTQAQASGFVSVMTSGIGLLANNLQLLVGVMATVGAVQLAQWMKNVTVKTYESVTANQAKLASTLAASRADAAATAATIAQGTATQAMIVLAREDAVVKLASANASVVSAKASLSAAQAVGAHSFALRAHRVATGDLIAAEAARSAALTTLSTLGRQQASVSAQITAATAAQGVAQASLNGATAAASIGARVATSALGLLGGPIGAITMLLGLGATAWALWGSKASEAEKQTAGTLQASTAEIIENLDKQIAKLRERNALVSAGITGAGQSDTPAAQRMIELRKQMSEAQTGTGRYANLPEIARMDILQKLGTQLGIVYAKTQELAVETEKLDAAGKQTKLQEWMTKLATKTEKMNAELAKARLELGSAFTPEIEARIRKQYEEKSKGTKRLSDEEKIAVKTARELQSEREKSIETQYGEIASIQEKTQQTRDEIATYGMSKTAIGALAIARLEEQKAVLMGFDGAEEQVALLNREIDARKELMSATAQKEALDANKKASEKAAQEWERTNDQIGQSLTDALLRGFESGKSFAENFRDTMKNMFKTLILQPIIQPIMTSAAGSITGALGMGGPAGSANGGLASNAMSLVSSANSLYGLFTGGMTSTLASGISSVGSAIGSSAMTSFAAGMKGATLAPGLMGPTTAGASGAVGAGATFGSLVTAAGGIAAGVMAGSLISGKFSAIGGNPNNAVYAGTAAGAAIGSIVPVIGTAIGAAVGGIVGGLYNRAFGMSAKEYGDTSIVGRFGTSGFNGSTQTPWEQEGGWFSSGDSGIKYGVMDQELTQSLSSAFGLLKMGAAGLAESIGVSSVALNGYSKQIELTLTDDAAKNQELILGLLDGVGEGLVTRLVPNIASFAKENETATQTLQRLSTSLGGANSVLTMLRHRLFDVSLAGAASASQLADVFGGLDNLANAAQAYYQVAYSDSERAALSLENVGRALGSFSLAMPTSITQLRSMVEALDLNTESGRSAYAVLVSLAPEFASTVETIARVAQEAADKLLVAYTGNGLLLPALDATTLKTLRLKDSLVSTYTVAGNISTLFLDAEFGLITFGNSTSDLVDGLNGAQQASLMLRNQMLDLSVSTKGGIIDFAGLAKALDKVDTATFTATIAKAFQNLADRISGLLGDINAERSAVRDSALSIIAPAVMTPAAIARQIAGINTTLPSNAGLMAAGAQLNAADALAAQRKQQEQVALGAYNPARAAVDSAAAQLPGLQGQYSELFGVIRAKEAEIAQPRKYSEGRAYVRALQATMPALYAQLDQLGTAMNAAADAASASKWNEVAALQNQYATAASASAVAQAAATAAAADAKAVSTAYANSLQNFALDAAKSVSKLSNLREETLKYYQAQKQLSDLMGASAAGLRKTVADYRMSQLSPDQQFNSLQADYAKAYAMALSTDGEVLAGYGDQMNGMLNQLLESARDYYGSETQYNSFANTAIARAEAIAARLDAMAPQNYEQESLDLLAQIDITLVALDASAKTADQLIVGAINAGRDATVNGLRQVINALTGQSVAAFASGGTHLGGARLVGEYGPELEITGPSRIYNASQTRSMLGGGGNTARLEALVERLVQENSDLRIEVRSIAITNDKMARQGDRNEIEGVKIRTDADEPIDVKVTA